MARSARHRAATPTFTMKGTPAGFRRVAEFREVVGKVVVMLSERDIRVTQQGTQAYVKYDPKTNLPNVVNLPYIPDDADETLLGAVRGFLDHEVAHVLFTDPDVHHDPRMKDPKSGQVDKVTHNIWNILEDTRIEREMQKRFPGSAANLSNVLTFMGEQYTKPQLEKAIAAGDRAMVFGVLGMPLMRAWAGQQAAQHIMDDLNGWKLIEKEIDRLSPFKERVASIVTTKDALDLACDIIASLKQEPPKSGGGKGEDQENDESEGEQQEDESSSGSGEGEQDKQEKEQEGEKPDGSEGEQESEGDQEGDQPEEQPEGEESSEDQKESGEGEGEQSEDSQDSEDGSDGDQEGDQEEAGEGSDGEGGEGESDGDTPDEASPDDGDGGAADEETGGEKEGSGASEGGESGEDEGQTGSEQESGGAEEATGEVELVIQDMLEGLEKKAEDGMAEAISMRVVEGITNDTYLVYTTDRDEWKDVEIDPHVMPEVDKELISTDNKMRQMIGQMQSHMRRMFAQQAQTLNVGGMRRGRLQASALHRLAVNDDRVFFRREEHEAMDTAVSLVIDCSGSMSGEKIQVACHAAYALSQTLERLGIIHSIDGFTTHDCEKVYAEVYGSSRGGVTPIREEMEKIGREFSRLEPIRIYRFKKFEEKLTLPVKRRLIGGAGGRGYYSQLELVDNVDGESILKIGREVVKRREPRKIMMVLSDGYPAAIGVASDLNRHLKFAVTELERMGIETVGIGICSDAVQKFYPKSVVINKVEELPAVVIGQLRRFLIDQKKVV